jgi:hypothetical protein
LFFWGNITLAFHLLNFTPWYFVNKLHKFTFVVPQWTQEYSSTLCLVTFWHYVWCGTLNVIYNLCHRWCPRNKEVNMW